MWQKKCSLSYTRRGCRYIPQRYVVTFMCFFAMSIINGMRGCAIVFINYLAPKQDNCTIERNNMTATFVHKFACPDGVPVSVVKLKGTIHGIFFLGFCSVQFIGAYCAKNISAKYTLGCSVLFSSLFFIMTVPAGCTSGTYMIVVRFFFGLFQGPSFPAVNELLSEWIPVCERTLLAAIVYAGFQIGTIVVLSISNYLLLHMSWIHFTYAFSGINIIWLILFLILCFDKPKAHPWISTSELKYLSEKVSKTYKHMPTPWRSMVSSKPLWVLIIAHAGHDFAMFVMITELPTFDITVNNLKLVKNGDISSVPFLVVWFTTVLIAYISNKLIAMKYVTITVTRKVVSLLSATLPGIGMVCASYFSSPISVYACVIISMSFMGGYYSGTRVNTLDLSPTHAAMIMAVVTASGSTCTSLSPFVINGVLSDLGSDLSCAEASFELKKNWRTLCWLVFAVLDLSHVPFLMFGSGEVQPWNNVLNDKSEKKPIPLPTTISDVVCTNPSTNI